MKKDNLKYCYYEPKYFEDFFNISMHFTYEHDYERNPKSESEKQKIEKDQRDYLNKYLEYAHYRCYLCFNDKNPIGYIWFGYQEDDISKGFIDELYVESKYRQIGIATSLLKEAIRWMKKNKCSLIDIDVKAQNKGAIKLYRELGFTKQESKWVNLTMKLENDKQ